MKRFGNSGFGAWTLFSIIGMGTSLVTAGLIPRLVHAAPPQMHAPRSQSSGAWKPNEDPRRWEADLEFRFDRLPLEGDTQERTPWSDTYWPSNQGGIAARWNQRGSNAFKYRLYSEAQVRAMTQNQLALLSPAEKYDIFMGRFDYPTVKMVRSRTSPGAPGWEGICHGWSPASLNHPEPAPTLAIGKSGIPVPFGSSDIKGLLDQYYAMYEQADDFLGSRCRKGTGGVIGWIRDAFSGNKSCNDMNAGAFHVVLTNQLGLQHEGFVADVTRMGQVWNQPVYAYSSRIVGYRAPTRNAARGTVREVLIHTTMTYGKEIEPDWHPVVGTDRFANGSKEYDYSLHLDAAGRIIGGEYYTSNRDRPDFLWNAPRLEFSGYYAGLNQLAKSW